MLNTHIRRMRKVQKNKMAEAKKDSKMQEQSKDTQVKTSGQEEVQKEYKIKKNHITAVGRRKTASARIFLYETKGDILVNHVDINEYFPSEKDKLAWTQPFHVIGVSHPTSKFSATIKVEGSGKSGQLGAVVHGLSRALAEINEEYSIALRQAGLLTRDPRMKERKKYYLRGARKRPQYSKR